MKTKPTANKSRSEEFLISTASRDFGQLKDSLDEASDSFSFIVFPAGLSRTGPEPPIFHKSFCSDLRLRKLYELLKTMPAEIASTKVKTIFDDYFVKYQHKWSKGATILPERDHYSVAAALFLCAEFADDSATLARIDRWNDWYERNKGRSTHFDERARILPLFLMNTYCSMLINNGADIGTINAMIDGLKETTRITESVRLRPLKKWDSMLNNEEPIAVLPVVISWSHRILYDDLNAFLRSSVEFDD